MFAGPAIWQDLLRIEDAVYTLKGLGSHVMYTDHESLQYLVDL